MSKIILFATLICSLQRNSNVIYKRVLEQIRLDILQDWYTKIKYILITTNNWKLKLKNNAIQNSIKIIEY